MSDKLWRAVYDRFHKPQTDPEKKKENVERYHAMVKMMVAIERQNLLQIAEDKNFLNSDADLDSFIDGLETALIISMLVEDDTNEFMNVLQSSNNMEEKILATLALKSFVNDPGKFGAENVLLWYANE